MTTKWFNIALRNVIRNKRRSVTAILTVAVGTIAIVLSYGYINFTFWGLTRTIVEGGTGNMQIADSRLYKDFEETTLEFGIPNKKANNTIKTLTDTDIVRQAMKRLSFSGIVSKGEISTIFRGTGIEPKQERRLNAGNLSGGLKTGKYLKKETYEVLLAVDLARKLKAVNGDSVTLLATTVEGGLNAIDMTVVGTYTTGIPIRDTLELKIPITQAQELLLTDRISNIVLKLKDIEATRQMLPVIKKLLDNDLAIKTWYQLVPYFESVQHIYYNIFGVMGSIILLVVLLSVSNVMATSVMERVPEIGTLRAFGITTTRLKINFMTEGAIIGFIGGFFGAILAIIMTFIVNQSGYMMPPPPGRALEYPLMILPTSASVMLTVLVMLIIGVLASLFPISKVLKKKVVTQLNHV